MTREEILDQKLDQLAEHTLSGQGTSAADLARDTPELQSELERRLSAYRALERLRLPAAQTPSVENTLSFVMPAGQARELGRYRLESVLGVGGMGEVWRAFDTQLERAVAVKLLNKDLTGDGSAKSRFIREARAVAKIEHDNVVRVYDVAEIEGELLLAMPLLRGETLEARVRRVGPLPAAVVARIGCELLAGLNAAHRAGIVHRDVKPSNLWLEAPHDRALLLDFGLARPEVGDGLTQSGGIFGTPGYMSPEQARGAALDIRTDLFSAGAVLYFAVTGKAPFSLPGLNTLEMLERTKTFEPTPPHLVCAELPVDFSNFIQTLLHKDPNGRPASAELAASQLRRIGGLPTTELPSPQTGLELLPGSHSGNATERMNVTMPPQRPAARRRPLQVGIVICLVVLLSGLGLAGAIRSLQSRRAALPDGSSPSAHNSEWAGILDVIIARGPRDKLQYVKLNQPGVLPLLPVKDHVRIHALLNRQAYMYIVWIDTEGKADLIYPWDEVNKRRPTQEEPVTEFYWPSPTRAAQLGGGPAGTESLLLLAAEEKLPADVDIPQLFAGMPRQKSKFQQEAAWFENGQLVTNDRERSSIGFNLDRGKPDATKSVEIDDPVIRLQVLLRSEEMRKRFPYSRGVCFSNAGDR